MNFSKAVKLNNMQACTNYLGKQKMESGPLHRSPFAALRRPAEIVFHYVDPGLAE